MSHRSSDRQPFNHPFLYFITTTGMLTDHTLLSSRGQSGEREADKSMLYVLACFEQEIKEELKTEILWLRKSVQLTEEEQARWDNRSNIYNCWHKHHYFDMAKFTPPTVTTSMQSLSDRLKAAQKKEG